MWTTIVAKFASPCRRCGGQIKVGQKFRYGRLPNMKSGVGYHLKADCPSPDATKTVDAASPAEPAQPVDSKPAPLSAEEQTLLASLLSRSGLNAE